MAKATKTPAAEIVDTNPTAMEPEGESQAEGLHETQEHHHKEKMKHHKKMMEHHEDAAETQTAIAAEHKRMMDHHQELHQHHKTAKAETY